MFWKYNTNSSSQMDTLLAKEDVTLQEVMDAEDIINECRVQNKVLTDFLQKPEVIEELVTLITREPSIEIEEWTRFKYPNIACELLTCDNPVLNERIAGDEALLNKLYTFLESELPLNPLLASYFSKVLGTLIAKKPEQNWLSYQFTCLQVLDFLKAKDTFIPLMLKHLGTSAVMDLMLKLMTQVEGVETRQNILNWLDSQRIIQALVALLHPKIDKERHFNVAQLLCDFIKIARDTLRNSTERVDPDPLLNTLESPDTVSLLLDNILSKEKSDTAIVGGIQVLLALLDIQNNSSTDMNDEANDIEQKQKIISNISRGVQPRIKDLHTLLLEPPKQDAIVTTFGMLDPPLGNTRLLVTKLFASLIATGNEEVSKEIVSCNTVAVLLDLFFKYEWNNFLHMQVENCLISALKNPGAEGESNTVMKHVIVNCKLIELLLDTWKENDEQQSTGKGIRKGYMGHVISMVNKIVELCSLTPLGQFLKDSLPDVAKRLDEFKDSTLAETNKVQETLLGGVHPNNSNEDTDDYDILPFTASNMLQQQVFSQCQLQNLAPEFIEGYSGYNDETFLESGEIGILEQQQQLQQQQDIFRHIFTLNSLRSNEENRENQSGNSESKPEQNETYSSDSDDEPNADEGMDTYPWSSPKGGESQQPTIATPADPWNSSLETTDNAVSNVSNWADFSSAQFEADFSAAFSQDNFNNKGAVENDLKVVVENEAEDGGGSVAVAAENRPEAGDGRGKLEMMITSSSDVANEPSKPELEVAKSEETKQQAAN